MQSKRFPDGLVELVMSGKSCPPDFHGQAGNRSSVWFRVDGGPWEPAGVRSLHRVWEAMHVAESVAEFREYLEGL